MSLKSFDDRAKDAFVAPTSAEFGQKYLELLYTNWYEIARTVRRMGGLFVVLAVGFFVLAHTKNAEITLGPLKLTNLAVVQTIIPAIASFVAYEFVALAAACGTYSNAAGAVMQALYPSVFANDLEILLMPSGIHLWEESNWSYLRTRRQSGKAAKGLAWMATTSTVGLLIGTVLFLIYAYINLYVSAHTNVIAVSVSLAFAVFNAVRALLEFVDSQD